MILHYEEGSLKKIIISNAKLVNWTPVYYVSLNLNTKDYRCDLKSVIT